ncbi:hypothetical protein CRG98_027160 [Punica granatum]|uniref:Translation initiation factor 3 N-terminal domain-containing protein n=1 Tax=Punica granatum TaxID=22663 RepID=A0A2I0J8B9_PUNGR|nr:hypothetical protein CRG98_027160 [Punica granatum]
MPVLKVQRSANPPVVKIMDYHMERYKQQLQEKERAKAKGKTTVKSGTCKEIRFTVKAEAKDLAVKADGIKRLMDRGYRVKCMATGTEDQDLGSLLARVFTLIEDVSHVESGPRVEKRQAYVVVRHIKFGTKKGRGKKKVDVNAEIERQQVALASGDSSSIPEEEDFHVSGSEETEEENFHGEEKPGKVGIAWSMDKGNDDSSKMFNPGSNSNRGVSSNFQRPAQAQAHTAPAQKVTENRYARKTEQGRRFPPHNSVDNSNWGRGSRDTFRSDQRDRTRMPSDIPRQERSYPNFSRNSGAPPGEVQKPRVQRPEGPSPQDAGQSFGIFSNPRSNASNNQQ